MAETQQGQSQQGQSAQQHGQQQKVERSHYLLKNGTTVAVEDYDEKIHGKKVEETDEQYRARLEARAAVGRTSSAPVHARTTIANLHTFDSTQAVQQTAAPILPPLVSQPVESKMVATEDFANPNLVDPDKRTTTGVLVAPDVRPLDDKRREELQSEADKAKSDKAKADEQKAKQSTSGQATGGQQQK